MQFSRSGARLWGWGGTTQWIRRTWNVGFRNASSHEGCDASENENGDWTKMAFHGPVVLLVHAQKTSARGERNVKACRFEIRRILWGT